LQETTNQPLRKASSICDAPLGVPGDLPEVAVRIMEVARISTPESIVGRIGDDGAGLLGLLHHRIDLFS
jgi:hypothetical protein